MTQIFIAFCFRVVCKIEFTNYDEGNQYEERISLRRLPIMEASSLNLTFEKSGASSNIYYDECIAVDLLQQHLHQEEPLYTALGKIENTPVNATLCFNYCNVQSNIQERSDTLKKLQGHLKNTTSKRLYQSTRHNFAAIDKDSTTFARKNHNVYLRRIRTVLMSPREMLHSVGTGLRNRFVDHLDARPYILLLHFGETNSAGGRTRGAQGGLWVAKSPD